MKTLIQLRTVLPLRALRALIICLVLALFGFVHPGFAGPGSALLITNSTSYVLVTNTINPGPLITLETWVRTTNSNFGVIVSKLNAAGTTGFSLDVVSGWVGFRFGDTNGGYMTSVHKVNDGQWHHVAATYGIGAVRIYIDGALDFSSSRTPVTNMNVAAQTYIGNCSVCGLTNGLLGQVDELRIWSTNRAQSEIQSTMNEKLSGSENFLLACWRFDEGTGTNVADISGYSNSGAFSASARWANSTAPVDQPLVSTDFANASSGITTLHGRVNPRGAQTYSYFEWGQTTNYGNVTALANVGSGSATQAVNIAAGGMIPGFTNHFRIVATNTVTGRGVGSDQTIVPPIPDSALTGLHFDGTNDLVAIPRSISNDFTIEFWFRSTQVAGTNLNWWQGMGLVDAEVGGNFADFGTSLGNGQVLFGIGAGGNLNAQDKTISSGFVADGGWHHVAAERTRSSGLVALYIDGTLVATSNGNTLSLTSPTRIVIGALQTGNNFLNGDIDEVRLWNTVRSTNEIQNNMRVRLFGNEPGLVAYYRFDEGGGLFANDSSGHGNNGTLTNGPAWFNSDAPVALPLVASTLPGKIYRTHAYCEGYVVANVPATTVYFEWGTTTNYENVTPAAVLNAGYNWYVEQELTNLPPLSQFNYRIVASNALAVVVGTNQTLTTPRFYQVSSGFPFYYLNNYAAADYDNDGHLDFATTEENGDDGLTYLYLMHGDGDGHFTAVTNAAFPALDYYSTLQWIDYDNDGRLDLWLTGQFTVYTNSHTFHYDYARLFHNLGNGQFAEELNFMPPQLQMSVAWGDYDNDGLPDLYVTASGWTPIEGNLLFHNEGHGRFTSATSPLPDSTIAASWADFDNDGRLDLIVENNDFYTIGIYRNQGDGQFTQVSTTFPDSVYWWLLDDMNNDGFLDVVSSDYQTNYVFRNLGDGTFSPFAQFPGYYNDLSVADFDNDGRRDLMIGQYNSISLVRNLGNGTFAPEVVDPAIDLSFAFWGDFNGDGKTDLMTEDGSVFLNEVGTNTPPTAPGNLLAVISNGIVQFSWSPATDAQTPTSALSYSVRVGTSPGADDVWSSGSRTDGTRLQSTMGNAQFRTNAFLHPRVGGTLYWSVQTIDSQFMGGPFSTNGTFSAPTEIVAGATSITQTLASGEFIALGVSVTNTTTNTLSILNLFTPSLPPWVTLSTPQETLAPGAWATVIFTLNAMGLSNGVYQTAISLFSNGDIPETRIPITLNVGANGLVPGDLNHDGVVDLNELNTVIQYYRHVRP